MINIQNFTLQCKHQTSVMPGCQLCISSLPVNCSVRTETISITEQIPKLTDFGSDGSNTTIYPINLALVQEFMSESDLGRYDGNTFSNIPPIVELPNYYFLNMTWTNNLQRTRNLRTTLTVLELFLKMMLSFSTHWGTNYFTGGRRSSEILDELRRNCFNCNVGNSRTLPGCHLYPWH